ncbi:MAG: hypothetical protein PF693_17545 [Spirochaetia bacterium]|jgi:hypothetical protein|nr:hypothetical protein [Spirochaetia bacterium]
MILIFPYELVQFDPISFEKRISTGNIYFPPFISLESSSTLAVIFIIELFFCPGENPGLDE